MAKKVIGVHQAIKLEVNPLKAEECIAEYFYWEKKYIEAFTRIMEEMLECDPDIMVRFDRGMLCLGKKTGDVMVYLAPRPNSYEITFMGESSEEFNVDNIGKYLKLCEKSALNHIKKTRLQMEDEDRMGGLDLKDYLNQSQRRFCKLPVSKNVRLLAPAGSGKTYSLLWRCKWITEYCEINGKDIPKFLLVTFTKSASAEIEKRLAEDAMFVGIRANVRTLNAWGWEQNKRIGKELVVNKFERRNLITHDLLALIQKNKLLAQSMSIPNRKGKNAELIIDLIDLLKSLGFEHQMKKSEYNSHKRQLKELGLDKQLEEAYRELFISANVVVTDKKDFDKAENDFFEFWKKATVRLEENNRYTLEDQKYWAKQYLDEKIDKKSFPKGTTKYTHIFIDEFQDVNPLDIGLIKSIALFNGAGKEISITIVGDDDQSIFGWRGTTPKYILYPDKYFGLKFETCILDTNYRSPNAIVNYAKTLIEHNKEREPKGMKSVGKGRATVKVLCKQRVSPIDSTMAIIKELLEEGCNQIALIGRKQAAIFPYQIILSAERLQYNVESDIDIFDGEAMKSLQEIIKIVYRAKDEDNDDPIDELLKIFDKVNKYPLKGNERKEIINYLHACNIETYADALQRLKENLDLLKLGTIEKMCNVAQTLLDSQTVYEFMTVVESDLEGLDKDYNKADQDNHYKEPQFFRLTELSKKYDANFRKFYRDIERARKQSEMCRYANNSGNGNNYLANEEIPIHLLTATRSKGHEFDAVIILEANDNEWPAKLSEDIEEERRLFYVAMTRARKYLYFITSKENGISRFIDEAGIN